MFGVYFSRTCIYLCFTTTRVFRTLCFQFSLLSPLFIPSPEIPRYPPNKGHQQQRGKNYRGNCPSRDLADPKGLYINART
jgi:hypothetical protein